MQWVWSVGREPPSCFLPTAKGSTVCRLPAALSLATSGDSRPQLLRIMGKQSSLISLWATWRLSSETEAGCLPFPRVQPRLGQPGTLGQPGFYLFGAQAWGPL